MSKIRKFSPFNVYDFYGYLFPGAILTLFTLFLVVWFTPISFQNLFTLLEEAEKLHIILGVVGGSGFVATVYFAGHVNGTLSHLVFDQALMKRVIGYPVYTILGISAGMSPFGRAFNFYLLFFVNVLVLLPMIKLVFPDFLGFPFIYLSVLCLMSIVMVLGIIVAVLGGPDEVLNSGVHKKGHFKILKLLVYRITQVVNWFFFSGLSFSQRLFLPLINLITGSESVSTGVIERFKDNINRLSGLNSEEIGSDNFWLPYIYMHRHEPEVEEHLSNWMNLYAFLKNLSFVAFILCFEISLAVTLHYCSVVEMHHMTGAIDVQVVVLGFSFLYLSGWILAFRYWTIYKNYFTKYLIRSFSCLTLKTPIVENSEKILETENVPSVSSSQLSSASFNTRRPRTGTPF